MHESIGELKKRAAAKKRLEDLQAAAQYESSLYDFLKAGWQHIDPAPFVGGWHLQHIAEHLEAVTYGHIKRLVVNTPPRTSKSSVFSVAWPAWTWAIKPEPDYPLMGAKVQFLFASYAESLALRDSVKTRRLIESPWYQSLWRNRFALTSDQNTKIRFENTVGGYRLSTSVGGTVTGEGGLIIGIDDAHKADEAESETVRQGVIDWYDEVFSTRLNDPKVGAIVVIGQRVHEEDISGHLLKGGDFVHLCLPMEYEHSRHVNGWTPEDKIKSLTGAYAESVPEEDVFWKDPRIEEGDLLCEGRYGPDEITEQKKKPFVWAGQFQQRPAPKGGAIIKEGYWKLWTGEKFPTFSYILASVDTAYTEKEENDPSALTVWGAFRDENNNPRIMLIYAWQEWLEFPELVQMVADTCTVDNRKCFHPKKEGNVPLARFPVDRIIIEGKASGISVAQELARMVGLTGKVGVEIIRNSRGRWSPDKVARAHAVVHLFTDGMIYAPDRAFADMVINQCAIFPRGSHDDLVDTTTMALKYLRDFGYALVRQEAAMEVADELAYPSRGAATPLYPV